MNYLNMNDEKIVPTVVELNTLLADYHIYYQNLRNFHWNVVGDHFFDLHKKFEELYTDARLKIDEIAERILTLRHHPMSNLKDYLKIASIEEAPTLQTDKDMVLFLLDNHSTLLKQMSEVIDKAEDSKDEGTIDLMGAYIRELEKNSWMLEAFTKETKGNKKAILA